MFDIATFIMSTQHVNRVLDKKAQLSLGKRHYSLYSSCCSTDLQGHPRSMTLSHLKGRMRFPISDQGPILHHLAIVHPLRIDRQTTARAIDALPCSASIDRYLVRAAHGGLSQ